MPVLARAPGRVNLIGEHTDHQEGFVMPHPIAEATTVRTGPASRAARWTWSSAAVPGVAAFGEDDDPARGEPAWARIPAAVLRLLREAGCDAPAFDAHVAGDLPVGAGLSSSAALAVATALAAIEETRAAGRDVPAGLTDRACLAALCREAESRGAGVRCGIMDPWISLHGSADSATLLDCRSLASAAVPLPSARIALVLADTGVRHALAAGEYGRRRDECARAARTLGVPTLRDATLDGISAAGDALDPVARRRAVHVVTENARVHAAAAALRAEDARTFGALLDASHASLRDDFDVSCPELDEVAALARQVPGVLGARMVGGGFGGSVLCAVAPGRVEAAVASLAALGVATGLPRGVRVVTGGRAASVERVA